MSGVDKRPDRRWLDDLLTSGRGLARRDPQHRRLTLLNCALFIAVLVTLLFVPFDLLVSGHRLEAAVEAAAALVFAGCLIALRRGAGIDPVAWIACSTAVLTILVVVLGDGIKQAALAWAPLTPLLAFFLLGLRRGLALTALFAAAMLAGLLHALADGAPGISAVTILNGMGALTAATIGALVYEHSRNAAERHLEQAANVDFLTGLSNRRHFQAECERELARARRHGRRLSLLLLDIDHFKVINDTHGHEAGDEALCHLARLLVRNLRSHDLAGRIGGEEFGVLLPETGLAQAMAVAEAIRQIVETTPRVLPHLTITVTVSIGVAEATPDDPATDFAALFTAMFAEADRSLYRAKRSGRNAVAGPGHDDAPAPARPW